MHHRSLPPPIHLMGGAACIAILLLSVQRPAVAVDVTDLRCEYMTNPLGIDQDHPRLSWVIASDRRNEKQTAYQIMVSSSPQSLSTDKQDLWDSGKVLSDQSQYIPYAGAELRSLARCFWKVRVWTEVDGGQQSEATAVSEPAFWSMGILNPEDWTAKWITASRWFTPPAFRPAGFIAGSGGWADIDLGKPFPIDSIKLFPLKPQQFPLRFKIVSSDEPEFYHPHTVVDQSSDDVHLSSSDPLTLAVTNLTTRYLRLLIVQAPQSKAIVRQMQVFSGRDNVALMRPTRELGTSWNSGHAVFLVDGMPSQGESDVCPPDACPSTAAPLFRRAFHIDRKIRQATLCAAALGMIDVAINGQRVGNEVLGPPFTDATKRVIYVTHDVTPLLKQGDNAIGVTLGSGFFSTPGGGFGDRMGGDGPPRFLLQADIEFEDGTHQIVQTDSSWKWSRGEITLNDMWGGYSEDRRLAKAGWDSPGYSDAQWLPVAVTAALGGVLRSPMGPPVRICGELKPVRVEKDQAFFNVLSAGWPRLKVNGKAGQTIIISGRSLPALSFTLATDGPTVLEPRFVFFAGPLTIKVEGLSQPLRIDDLTIQLARADLRATGAFTCSNPFLNEVYDVLLRTHHNYDCDQPMDPTREKQGWTQDAQGMFDTAAYLTDVRGIYRKWWWDFADGQDFSGYLGSVVPVVGRQVNDWNSPWWSGVIVLVPWEHYLYYGDRQILADAYDPMRKYVDFLGNMATAGAGTQWDAYPYFTINTDAQAAADRMLIWNGAGDWQNPYAKSHFAVPAPMMTMPAWSYYATIVSKTAALLGNRADAAKYAAIADDVKSRFNAKYLHPDTGLYGDDADSETGQVLPLALGIVPAPMQELTYQRLLDAIHAHNDHLGTGFVALPFLLQTLVDHRETALANKMVNQQTYPGWKTLQHDGILGENWHGGGAQMPSTGGAIGMWLYQSVLGIRPDPRGPGFQRFLIAPQPDPATGLISASGFYDCPYGRISIDWKLDGRSFTLAATIPVGTKATVVIPTSDPQSVKESGASAANAVKFVKTDSEGSVFEAGSGKYEFIASSRSPQ